MSFCFSLTRPISPICQSPFFPYPTFKILLFQLEPLLTEGLYAYYPNGGFYKRHVDAAAGEKSTGLRAWSYLIYLNQNWREGDGGELRQKKGKEKKKRKRREKARTESVSFSVHWSYRPVFPCARGRVVGELRQGSHLRASFHSFSFFSFATLAPPLPHTPPPPSPPPLCFCLFSGYMGVAGRRMMTRRLWTCHPRRERSYSSGRIPCRMRCLRQVRSGWRSPVKKQRAISIKYLHTHLSPFSGEKLSPWPCLTHV